MQITKKGVPTEVAGVQPTLNEMAPSFNLPNINGETVSLDSLKGQTVLISIFPDINTRVCDLQTRHFFKVASDYPSVKIVNISNNTIDQLKDWCAVAGIEAEMLSDVELEFAHAYGIYLPEFELLARSIFVINKDGKLVYSEIVPEMAQEPNYETALEAAQNA
ncbi:MAG: peroxiredoxin [Erysipelothrix sp.]